MRLQVARLKQRVFPEQWRVLCLEMLDHSDALFREEVCWTAVREKTEASLFLVQNKKAQKVASTDLKAANLVLGLIARIAEEKIAYGDKHIYRGVLSLEGKSYRSIAETALHELHENEWLDYEQLKERLQQIAEAVKAAG